MNEEAQTRIIVKRAVDRGIFKDPWMWVFFITLAVIQLHRFIRLL